MSSSSYDANEASEANEFIAELPGSRPTDATFLPHSDPGPFRTQTDNDSAYWSIRSRMSFRSLFTRSSVVSGSTGFRSQLGATWRQELIINMKSGFGPGAPRNDKYRPVREGRERGGYLPRLKGIGRTGKAPAPVPAGLVQAAAMERPDFSDKTSTLAAATCASQLTKPHLESSDRLRHIERQCQDVREWMTDLEQKMKIIPLPIQVQEGYALKLLQERFDTVYAELQQYSQLIAAEKDAGALRIFWDEVRAIEGRIPLLQYDLLQLERACDRRIEEHAKIGKDLWAVSNLHLERPGRQ